MHLIFSISVLVFALACIRARHFHAKHRIDRAASGGEFQDLYPYPPTSMPHLTDKFKDFEVNLLDLMLRFA